MDLIPLFVQRDFICFTLKIVYIFWIFFACNEVFLHWDIDTVDLSSLHSHFGALLVTRPMAPSSG